jgi:hypothetical protein
MRPLPADATDFNWAIAEKSLVKDDAEIDAVDAAVVADPAAVVGEVTADFDELLHAARAITAAAVVTASAARFSELFM